VAAWEGVPIEEMIEIARALNFYSAFNIQTGGAQLARRRRRKAVDEVEGVSEPRNMKLWPETVRYLTVSNRAPRA